MFSYYTLQSVSAERPEEHAEGDVFLLFWTSMFCAKCITATVKNTFDVSGTSCFYCHCFLPPPDHLKSDNVNDH